MAPTVRKAAARRDWTIHKRMFTERSGGMQGKEISKFGHPEASMMLQI
jgi:hypothetical protein